MSEEREITVVAQIDPRLADALDRSADALDRLAEKVEEGTRRTVEEIQRVAQSAARTELAKQRAELKSIGPLISQQQRQIEIQSQKISGHVEEVHKKFDRAASELWASYVRDTRRLGAHIFEILESECQRGLEKRVKEADFDVFTGITRKVYERGSQSLNAWMDRARGAARQFTELRQRFKATLAETKLSPAAPSGSEFAVPVWLVKVQDEAGKVYWEVVGVSSLEEAHGGEHRYNLKETPEYKELTDKVRDKLEAIVGSFPWEEYTEEKKTAIAKEIQSLSNQGAITADLKRVLTGVLMDEALFTLP